MKIAFVINDVATEKDNYSTIRLARVAGNRGHDVAFVSLGDFIYQTDGTICAMATIAKKQEFKDDTAYLAHLQDGLDRERVEVENFDIVMLRSDPAEELLARSWAPSSSLLFAQIAASHGTIVVNDPKHLTDAVNKTYFQNFPEELRPLTCITRHPGEIKAFIDARGGTGVIKPLQGSGGQGVFVIDENTGGNLNQIIDAVTRDGYAIVQEYLPEAKNGDLRLLTLNGRPFKVDGTYACIRRFSKSEDHRSNISAGGGVELVEPNEAALRAAELAAPKLIADGMYFCGLDIVGDKMIEINVDTPGGLSYMEDLSKIDFSGAMLDDLEHKVQLKKHYGRALSNRQLAVM